MFCNGMVVLPDGRVFVNGGNLQYDPFHGEPRNAVFDPAIGSVHRRREHGARALVSDGHDARRRPRHDVLGIERNRRHEHRRRDLHGGLGLERGISGGLDAAALSAHAPADRTARSSIPGRAAARRFFNPATHTGRPSWRPRNYTGTRTYGTSVLLPLTPANGYRRA